MKKQFLTLAMALFAIVANAQFDHQRVYSTFDNLPLAKADTFNNGEDLSGGFSHYGRLWNNSYFSWGGFSGWALSNMGDTVTPGFMNQYSAITGQGVSGTSNYMVSTGNGAYIKLDEATNISGAYFTNSTYAARDMEQGSGFSKKFGGDDGSDEDFFRVIISSYLADELVDSTIFYLADYRFADNSEDYIIKDWTFVDFNNDVSLDFEIDSISFRYEGSDVGEFGLNTPRYICMDDFNAVSKNTQFTKPFTTLPADSFYNGADGTGGISAGHFYFPNSYNEMWGSWSGWSYSTKQDTTTPGFTNQYSSINYSSEHFVAGGQQTEIRSPYNGADSNSFIDRNTSNLVFSVTNSTYTYLDMLNGSGFSKKFGGDDGTDPDYFRLIATMLDSRGVVFKRDTVYLADFRFENREDDYILKNWTELEISDVDADKFSKLVFNLESSDNGMFGMNTPANFCFNVGIEILGNVNNSYPSFDINLYPNPALDNLTLSALDVINKVEIRGLDGRIVKQYQPTSLTQNVNLNLKNLTSGVYFARVYTAKGMPTKKFIKR